MPERGSMHWERSSPELTARFQAFTATIDDLTQRKMFGETAGFVNGNMVTGLHNGNWFVRLPEDEIAVVKKQGGRDFEPVAGHKMGGYVIVPGNWRAKLPAALIKRALEVTRKMPAKTPKKKAAAKR